MEVVFFKNQNNTYLILSDRTLEKEETTKLSWLLEAEFINKGILEGKYKGTIPDLVSPWSTNAVEIVKAIGLNCIKRIEFFEELVDDNTKAEDFDHLLERIYNNLDGKSFSVNTQPQKLSLVEDVAEFNKKYSLALSTVEISYLTNLSKKINRKLTDAEVYAFSQINSEHCRHKIFNAKFTIDGQVKEKTLFEHIKSTTKANPERVLSAYKDNVAFIKCSKIKYFFPKLQNPTLETQTSKYSFLNIETAISLKAETHNFPTTVEPFYGASTGSGGEIRDRLAGGRGALPLAGTAVYMTSYPRFNNETSPSWKSSKPRRNWKYQAPEEILIKASNGASDFGNKFGQPLVNGSILTFEGSNASDFYAYDRAVMLAGGIGFTSVENVQKDTAEKDDLIIIFGGDNYRIGMAGGSASSVSSGTLSEAVDRNAIQRANPEMQKRVYNAIRVLVEEGLSEGFNKINLNKIKLVHDHGAGGHINCLVELLEPLGGVIYLDELPIGDSSLSPLEILCNESQERMGLVIASKHLEAVTRICERESAPVYCVGKITGSKNVVVESSSSSTPIFSLELDDLLGNLPQLERTSTSRDCEVKTDKTQLEQIKYKLFFQNAASKNSEVSSAKFDKVYFEEQLRKVLQHETVACKDWLTNKVDRCVTGLVAQQQCVGEYQLPLANMGVLSLDYLGNSGVAVSTGHAPKFSLCSQVLNAQLSVTKALTNLVWAPLRHGLTGISLSANWMWPAGQEHEDASLYQAVETLSEFSIALKIPVPTGKDSLSMTMGYPDGKKVKAPGTVIVTAVAETADVRNTLTPNLEEVQNSKIVYLDFTGIKENYLACSILAEVNDLNILDYPQAINSENVKNAFELVQKYLCEKNILAGHDISAGGLVTSLLEMCFAGRMSMKLDMSCFPDVLEVSSFLFSEKPGCILQLKEEVLSSFLADAKKLNLIALEFGEVESPDKLAGSSQVLSIKLQETSINLDIEGLRGTWFKTSTNFEKLQRNEAQAEIRAKNIFSRSLSFSFPKDFDGTIKSLGGREDFFEINPGFGNAQTSASKNNISTNNSANISLQNKLRVGIIREKGCNSERELAMACHLAGMEVDDITMTDLLSGRIKLSSYRMLGFAGGFSHSDVLGAGKGWGATFKFNPDVKSQLEEFYQRPNTLSIGICNGCQLLVSLGALTAFDNSYVSLEHNESGRFECGFKNTKVQKTNSVFFNDLEGTELGVWVAHGEGRFRFNPETKKVLTSLGSEKSAAKFEIPLIFSDSNYPHNPNGSELDAAAISSIDGRHLAIMPHPERSIFPWNWGFYPVNKNLHQVSPWGMLFGAAKKWLERN